MDTEESSQTDILADPIKSALTVMDSAKQDINTPRAVMDGSLIGTCFAFIAALLGVPHLDAPLTVAIVAFAIALPVLCYGFVCAIYKVETHVPGWRVLAAILISGWAVEAFGTLAVGVGVFGVIIHISLLAIKAVFITIAFTCCLPFLSLIAFILFYALRALSIH